MPVLTTLLIYTLGFLATLAAGWPGVVIAAAGYTLGRLRAAELEAQWRP